MESAKEKHEKLTNGNILELGSSHDYTTLCIYQTALHGTLEHGGFYGTYLYLKEKKLRRGRAEFSLGVFAETERPGLRGAHDEVVNLHLSPSQSAHGATWKTLGFGV